MIKHLVVCLLAPVITLSAWACSTDTVPGAAGSMMTLQLPGTAMLAFTEADLSALPRTSLTQRLTVTSSASGASERTLVYAGVLLRDVLLRSGPAFTTERGARTAYVEAIASDGYRAVFSWGELFNSPAGEQVLVITTQDGKRLDDAAGPIALRALGDLRPGPRHVRNLCALVVRTPP